MSRVPPFPTRRRSPSNGHSSAPGSSTKPLQISRPLSRPETPSRSPTYAPPNTAPIGPSRPQRSELRGRVTDNGTTKDHSSPASPDHYRDSITTTRSDVSGQLRSQQANSRPKPSRNFSASTDDGNEATPTSLTSVMSAFKDAGTRRRAMTNGSDDFEYQRQRQDEIEAEKVRQQRIQEKAMKRKGNTRAGDIDGVYTSYDLTPALRWLTS